jgi:hypothetical protein
VSEPGATIRQLRFFVTTEWELHFTRLPDSRPMTIKTCLPLVRFPITKVGPLINGQAQQ